MAASIAHKGRAQRETFTVAAKKRLVERGGSIAELARKLRLHRNTISGAINRPHRHLATQVRIRRELNLPPP